MKKILILFSLLFSLIIPSILAETNGTYRNISFSYSLILTPAGAGGSAVGSGHRCNEGYDWNEEKQLCILKSSGITTEKITGIISKIINLKNIRWLLILIGIILILWYYKKKNYIVIGIGALLILIGLLSKEEFIKKYLDIITPKISNFFDNIINFIKENINPRINNIFNKIINLFKVIFEKIKSIIAI